jgi:hypothetical protein
LKEAGEVALALLRLARDSADIFPPLKTAAGGALHIAELVLACLCYLLHPSSYICLCAEIQITAERMGQFWS